MKFTSISLSLLLSIGLFGQAQGQGNSGSTPAANNTADTPAANSTGPGNNQGAACATPATNFPRGDDDHFWMEMEFFECCHPIDNPTEAEVVQMLADGSDWLLNHTQQFQADMNGSPTTITDLTLTLYDYSSCIFPDDFANDPDFWCLVTLDIQATEPIFAPGVLAPGQQKNIKEFFGDATQRPSLEAYIQYYLWQVQGSDGQMNLEQLNGRYSQWNLIHLVGLGGTPCDPDRSGDNPGNSAELTWEQQQAATADANQEEGEEAAPAEGESAPESSAWSSMTKTGPIGMIMTTAWMVGSFFF